MGKVAENLLNLIAKQVEDNGIVVWYDPRSEFVPFVNHLADTADGSEVMTIDVGGESASLATYFFQQGVQRGKQVGCKFSSGSQ